MVPLWRSAVLVCLLVLTACGGAGNKTPTTTSEPPPVSTTTTTLALTVEVTPPSGRVGTTFTFMARGFKPEEKVTFEVDRPNGAPFTGPAHPVAPDGTVKVSYRVTAATETGTYGVKAIGDQGTLGQGQFDVTAPAGGTATTARRSTATTARRTTATTRSTTATTAHSPTTAGTTNTTAY